MNQDKLLALKNHIKKLDHVLVAFSGGIDSTFLLKICRDLLGKKNLLAATVKSSMISSEEIEETKKIIEEMDVNHIFLEFDESKIPQIYENSPERCYFCKKEIFKNLLSVAKREGINFVLDGSNADDTKDFRPGMKALKELGVKSPLMEAGLTKNEIRYFARKMNLSNWAKPSMACLASRFPYGERLNREKLKRVEISEKFLKDLGFKQFRVRSHQNLARIEVLSEDFDKVLNKVIRKQIVEKLENAGFLYVTVDLVGYRTGSMNEGLQKEMK